MLVPAILYKDEIQRAFAKELYTKEHFYYNGYAHCNTITKITLEDNVYQFAIVNDAGELKGYLAYRVDPNTESVYNFGLYSFDKGNPLIGYDLFTEMARLVSLYHRVEWRMIGGNPVKKHYDKFCKKHGGNVVRLHDVCKDPLGNYVDEYIYEIVKGLSDGKSDD